MLLGNGDILNIGLFWGGVVFGMVIKVKKQEETLRTIREPLLM